MIDFKKFYRHIVLVGNGSVLNDWSLLVEEAELVVRFNFCNHYGGNTGRKTSILALNNVGQPAMDMLHSGLPECADCSQILFTRPVETHIKYYDLCGIKEYPKALVVVDSAMAFHFKLKNFMTVEPDYYGACFEKLIRVDGKSDFVMPSAGFVGLEYLAGKCQFSDMSLIGFTFEGWDGHPWQKEKRVVERYQQDGWLNILT